MAYNWEGHLYRDAFFFFSNAGDVKLKEEVYSVSWITELIGRWGFFMSSSKNMHIKKLS